MKVTNVEVKQVDLPETMMRAMAKQAEAEREKRSKIIHAEGEFAAAQRLIDAAHLLASEPTSIQLRYLQTLTEIGVEKNTTIIFPVPVDLLAGLRKAGNGGHSQDHRTSSRRQNRRTVCELDGQTDLDSAHFFSIRLRRRDMVSDDTEITLGVGRLLGLFFLLVAICGVFFSIGYSMGKSNAREQALDEPSSQVLAAGPGAASESERGGDKSSASLSSKPDAAQPAHEEPSTSSPQSNLTFYKAVQQSGEKTPATPNDGKPAVTAGSVPAQTTVPDTAQNASPARETAPPGGVVVRHSTPVTGPGTLVVQIAALTREDDAVSLAGALRKKDYSVFVVKNPAVNDKFYHVQVGPFTTLQEAEAMKTKLTAEGYNPIVKR